MIHANKLPLFIIVLALSSLALLAPVKAVDPTDTFYGTGAGNGTTTGVDDSAFGYNALHNVTTGDNNTASGALALYSNTTGGDNTASGNYALYSNTTGGGNTASGSFALSLNTTGSFNTASGGNALSGNTTGQSNTATGTNALYYNTTGTQNTGIGVNALVSNHSGNYNTAVGVNALYRSTGSFNVALGQNAGTLLRSGNGNIYIGQNAGSSLTSGNGNIYIGQGVTGVGFESNTTRIRNTYTSVASGRAVYVNADNTIGTLSSSRRFKQQIQPMEKTSETLYALKPVTFRYKKEVDPRQALSFGLIAEDVNKVDPDLVTRDQKGEPETVRYEAVNAMLLNEFLKEHHKVEDLEAIVAEQRKEVSLLKESLKAQASQIASVSDQLGMQRVSTTLVAAAK